MIISLLSMFASETPALGVNQGYFKAYRQAEMWNLCQVRIMARNHIKGKNFI